MRWHPDLAKSVAGPTTGTAGPMGGTVPGSTNENYPSQSDDRDRRARFDLSSGPTTGTHIVYQEGCGDEREKDHLHEEPRYAS
jgi:hypothetical protein